MYSVRYAAFTRSYLISESNTTPLSLSREEKWFPNVCEKNNNQVTINFEFQCFPPLNFILFFLSLFSTQIVSNMNCIEESRYLIELLEIDKELKVKTALRNIRRNADILSSVVQKHCFTYIIHCVQYFNVKVSFYKKKNQKKNLLFHC